MRIVPTGKSNAAKGNIREAYILFNYFQPDVNNSPFPQKADGIKPETESVNNQVILVPKSHKANVEDSAFWMVYQPNSQNYQLGFALNAAFDVVAPGTGKTQDYFLPTACAQCHGHDDINDSSAPAARPFPYAKTNYLDTDQWYDMVGFDFPATKTGKFDVIFDGGTDHKSKPYAMAFAVIVKLNEHIKKQNEESLHPKPKTGPKPDEYKVLAVKKWLELHKVNPKPVSSLFDKSALFKRSIGPEKWNEKKPLDAALLPLLDRYCFRCHSTVRYDVFDRKGMQQNAFLASFYVGGGIMPQGRRLSEIDKDREDLVKLLDQLSNENN